jgi:sec-independent protein translocase protein TatB
MFDIGWSELLVVAVVTILVVGPKDLPGMLRTFGKTMSQVRRTANDFKRQFNDALREAENDSGLKDTSDQLKSIGSINPVANVKKELDDLKSDVGSLEPDKEAAQADDSKKTDTASAAPIVDKAEPKSGSDAA